MNNKKNKGVQPTYRITQAANNLEALKELSEASIDYINTCSPCSLSFPTDEFVNEAISEAHLIQSYRVLKVGSYMSLFVSHHSDYRAKKLAEKVGFEIVDTIVRLFQYNNVTSVEHCVILYKSSKKAPTDFNIKLPFKVANDSELEDKAELIYSNKIYVASGFGLNKNTKPIVLIKELLETLLPKSKNCIVLDFFHDTGVTALACIETGNEYNYLGIDVDYESCINSKSLIEQTIQHKGLKTTVNLKTLPKPFEKRFSLHNGDCLKVLKQYPDNYFDSIVSDPPYGIQFLKLGWDHSVPPVDIWKECLRVLKPGGYLAAFADSSTHDLMTYNIRMAGFEILPMLSWLCASTKHKGRDVSKDIDKKLGKENERPLVKTIKNKNRVSRSYHKEEHLKPEYHVTSAASEEAKTYEGCSTALKTACEPITLARKSSEGSYADNILKHGTGVLNIGACAIPNHPELDKNRDSLRIPSNVIHDGSDAVLELLQEKARYFYCAKVTKEDKNSGLDPIKDKRLLNKHPTVKPHELMKWLVTLLNPVAGMKTLDPFMGSGSTGKAAVALKELDLHFTGIDLDPDFCEIADKRITDILHRQNSVNNEQSAPVDPELKVVTTKKTPRKSLRASNLEGTIGNKKVDKNLPVKCIASMSNKFEALKGFLPNQFNRYIEPISGNGSLFLELQNKQSLINDSSKELITFYQLLRSRSSKNLVEYIGRVQKERELVENSVIKHSTTDALLKQFKGICTNSAFEKFLKREIENLKPNPDHFVIKTAVYAALFYSYREIYNQKLNKFCLEHIAVWFVLRELAYSGMVRFNKKGLFNVPYGKSLNSKNLISRLNNLIELTSNDFYKNTAFSHLDITSFFKQHNNFNQSDFMLINTANHISHDHSELIKLLQSTAAQIMVIVKNSPHIRKFYEHNFTLTELSTEYLVVTNYDHQDKASNDNQLIEISMKEAA